MSAKNSKRRKGMADKLEPGKRIPVEDAVKALKECASAKFDETVEVSMNLGIDPRHADQQVRGVVQLPHGIGKTVRVAVFAKGDKAEEAKAAGADIVGAEDLAERIQGGEMDFDRCVATPDMMSIVGRLGKVLGPRGLMPNPKLGTVTPDVGTAVKAAKGGQSMVFFPEGTFIKAAGVGRFRAGAFSAATNGEMSVVPVAIFGTRRMMSSGQFLPRPCRIRVDILPSISPDDPAFADNRQLAEVVRQAILDVLDEPDLLEKEAQ